MTPGTKPVDSPLGIGPPGPRAIASDRRSTTSATSRHAIAPAPLAPRAQPTTSPHPCARALVQVPLRIRRSQVRVLLGAPLPYLGQRRGLWRPRSRASYAMIPEAPHLATGGLGEVGGTAVRSDPVGAMKAERRPRDGIGVDRPVRGSLLRALLDRGHDRAVDEILLLAPTGRVAQAIAVLERDADREHSPRLRFHWLRLRSRDRHNRLRHRVGRATQGATADVQSVSNLWCRDSKCVFNTTVETGLQLKKLKATRRVSRRGVMQAEVRSRLDERPRLALAAP